MHSPDTATLAAAFLPAVREAGMRIMEYYAGVTEMETKADGSPVSDADRDAEAVLEAALTRLAPNVPVIAEEAASTGRKVAHSDLFFLVDPLDGTREFAERRPEFTINVALIKDRRPIFGLIYAPALGQLYWTQGPQAAFKAYVPFDAPVAPLESHVATRLHTKPVHGGAQTIVASRSHGSADLDVWLKTITVADRVNIGSSLKFCLVAEGKADLYPRFGPTKEWDTAAGHAIAEAAGGIVTQTDGTPLLYGKVTEDYLNPGFIVWQDPAAVKRPAAT